MSMMCRPIWPFLLMYESHDMRHIGFPQVDGGQLDPRNGASQKYSYKQFKQVIKYFLSKFLLVWLLKI